MDNPLGLSISDWIENLQSKGRFAFSLSFLQEELPGYSDNAVKSALRRLSLKGQIVSIHKGYYLIIPPQYKSKGILPPALFLDSFMKELDRPYYVALLNAAAYHGASHQQPQEFFVVTNFPVLRPKQKKGLKINYISKKKLPEKLIEIRKTEAGFLKISNSILTATDLIQYEKRVGGINRVAAVLTELNESLKPEDFDQHLLNHIPTSALQRLGYLLEVVFKNQVLANALYTALKDTKAFRTPLKVSAPTKGFPLNAKWKVVINTTVNLDE